MKTIKPVMYSKANEVSVDETLAPHFVDVSVFKENLNFAQCDKWK